MNKPRLELSGQTVRLSLRKAHGNILAPSVSVRRTGYWENTAYGPTFLVMGGNGDVSTAPIRKARLDKRRLAFSGSTGGTRPVWTFAGRAHLRRKRAESVKWDLSFVYHGKTETSTALAVTLRVNDSGIPRWLVPAMFYKDNRPEDCVRRYPRYSFAGGDHREFVSDAWAFRGDRTSLPAVFCWTDRCTTALAAPLEFSRGLSGVAFRGNRRDISLTLNFPYREEPVSYNTWDPAPVVERTTVQPGDEIKINFHIYAAGRDLHAYDPFLRDLYDGTRARNPLHPWMSKSAAQALLSFGLHRWHFDEKHAVLYETCSFDAYFGKKIDDKNTYVDRPHMHTAWTSGAPSAYALMWYAVENGKPDYYRAAVSVLDKISSGTTPAGTFWPEWTLEHGWSTGWNPNPDWAHARTLAEASLFMTRALALESARGRTHPDWARAVTANLDFAVRRQAPDGNYGTYYDVHTGTVREWRGAGGMLWIPALLAGAGQFQNQAYRDSALKAAGYYTRFIDDEYIYGAPEDVHLTPTSEDGYNALIAYLILYESTRDGRWLAYARKAADWTMTFRWTYNTPFPEDTILGKYDFRTRGGDMASVSNNHLHNYGLICHPELLRLWEYTGDDYYLDRARDHLFCFHQFIARRDGDFNARKGMISEQWYHTDWWQPKGSMLQLAHAWCAGLIIYADLYTHAYGDILVDWRRKKVHLLEPVELADLRTGDGLRFRLRNDHPEETPLRLGFFRTGAAGLLVELKGRKSRVKVNEGRQFFDFVLPGRESVIISAREI